MGRVGRAEVRRATARLGLSKWHAGRAMRGRKRTVSADWIVPLRQELAELRMDVARALGRPVQMPQPWAAPAGQPGQPGQYQGGGYNQYPNQYPPQGWGRR